MSNRINIQDITSGYRTIQDGSRYNPYFSLPDDSDRIIIEDGEVEETVDLMKKVVWKYLNDTKEISRHLKGSTLETTCRNTWEFLYNHIQYKLDKKGLEQLRRPCRSWAERTTGIDCDCFSIFVSSILTNLKIPHKFRIAKYNQDAYQHVYVIVPKPGKAGYYTIDCVLSRFNYEKPFTKQKDFTMSLNGINVAVLSGTSTDVMDLISGFDSLYGLGAGEENDQAIYEHLVKTRNLVAEKPHLIDHVEYSPAFLKMLDYAIENWNTPNRDKALEILAKNEDNLNNLNGTDSLYPDDQDELNADLGKLFNKKKTTAKKGFFKKVGEAVKKGGKAFIKYNPVTISARSGFLVAMKLNIKKMASKLKWGYATKEQAAAKKISTQEWEKSKKALAKVEDLFANKLQGNKNALKKAILNGRAGGLNGTEDNSFEGLGVVAAATLAAAVPVIASTLKILVDSGLMSKEEAANLEAEVNAKASEAATVASDPDIQNSSSETAITDEGTPTSDSGSEGGILAMVKKKPLLFAGGAVVGLWGLSKMLSKKKTTHSELSGTTRKRKTRGKSRGKGRSGKGKKKLKAITLT